MPLEQMPPDQNGRRHEKVKSGLTSKLNHDFALEVGFTVERPPSADDLVSML